MFKKIISTVFVVLVLVCTSANAQESVLKGSIKNLKNDTLVVTYTDLSNPFKNANVTNLVYIKDTIVANKGKFDYKPKVNSPILITISPIRGYKKMDGRYSFPSDNKSICVVLPLNTNVNLKGDEELHAINYTADGCSFNKQYSELRKKQLHFDIDREKLYMKLDTLRYNKASDAEIDAIKKTIELNRSEKRVAYENYITNHLNTDASAYLANYYGKMASLYNRYTDEVQHGLFKSFIEHARNHAEGYRNKQERITKVAEIKVGGTAPNFVLNTLDSQGFFRLHQDTSAFIVLDFWGSWCAPCKAGFPKMKEYHQKYGKTISFIGIDCKDTQAEAEATIKQFGLKWTQLANGKTDSKDVAAIYKVQAYPTKVIIDKDKNIVGIYLGEDKAFYNKLDELMAK